MVFLVLRVLWAQSLTRDSLKDDDLAGRMGLQLKELNKIMATLEGHKLVRMYVYPSHILSYIPCPIPIATSPDTARTS